MSGCKTESGDKGGQEVVVKDIFGLGGDTNGGSGRIIGEGGEEDGWDEDREGQIAKC